MAWECWHYWPYALIVLKGKNPLNPMTGAAWTWLALFMYAVISCVWSPNRETSLFLLKYHLPYIITFVGLIPLIVQDPRDVRYVLKLTLFFGTFVMLLLLLGTRIHAWGRTIVIEQGMGVMDRVGNQRARLGPLAVASMAGQIMIIGVLMNFVGIGRVWQLLRWFVGFLALALIFRSQSRGQLIAAILAMMSLIPYGRGTKRITSLVVGLTSIALIMVTTIIAFNAFGDTGNRWTLDTMESTFQSTRLAYSSELLTEWGQSGPLHWLFGLGSSASFDILKSDQSIFASHGRASGTYCHVVVVEILAELGFFGLCIYLLFLGLVVRDALRLLRLSKNSVVDRGVAAATVAVLLFQFILTFKEGSFLTHTFTFGWGLILARMTALKLAENSRERRQAIWRWYQRYWATALPGAPPQAIRPTY